MFDIFNSSPSKKRRSNEQIAKERLKEATGLSFIEDALDVSANIVDSIFSLGSDD